jgi:glycosyltransferase involved in cell wall biosynthesis
MQVALGHSFNYRSPIHILRLPKDAYYFSLYREEHFCLTMNPAMRVLLIDTTSAMGGAQWSLLELATRFARHDIQVEAAVPAGPLADKLCAAGIRVHQTPLFRPRRQAALLATIRRLTAMAKFWWRLLGIARASQAEVLYANSLAAALIASFLPLRRPLVWHVRDLRLPVEAAQRVARHAQRIVAASQAIDELLCELLPRDTLGRIKLVVNGIDVARFAPADRGAARRALGLPEGVPVVGMLAHMVPWKRHDLFLKMAARIKASRPDVRFIMAGQDLFGEHASWVARLHQQAREMKLESAMLWLDQAGDTAPVIAAMDVLVHPPSDEPFGRVLCEAMAMQVPVVAVDKAGPAGIVADGETGLLALRREPDELAARVLELLADPARAERMGAAGRGRVVARFNVDRTVAEAATVCRNALTEYQADHARASRRPRKPLFLDLD